MTELQQKLQSILDERKRLAKVYDEKLERIELLLKTWPADDSTSGNFVGIPSKDYEKTLVRFALSLAETRKAWEQTGEEYDAICTKIKAC